MIDSDKLQEIESNFENSVYITRYQCSCCNKLIFGVPGCGFLDHQFSIQQHSKMKTLKKCSLCKSSFYSFQKGTVQNLKKLDNQPISELSKEKLRFQDPGFQITSPSLFEQVRSRGGIPLRLGRLFSLGFILFNRIIFIPNIDERNTQIEEILSKVFLEWNILKKIFSCQGQQILRIVNNIALKYLQNQKHFDLFSLYGLDNQTSKENRGHYQKAFIQYCIQSSLSQYYHPQLEPRQEFALNSLSNQLQGIFRLQGQRCLQKFLIMLSEQNDSFQSKIWNTLIFRKDLMLSASFLSPYVKWLKYVRKQLHRKITKINAKRMSISSFIHEYGGEEIYRDASKVWTHFKPKNLSKECKPVHLMELDQSDTSIITFCLSSSDQDLGYPAWLLLQYLVGSHNAFHNLLSQADTKQKVSQHGLSSHRASLFDLASMRYFKNLDFLSSGQNRTEQYYQMNSIVESQSASTYRVGSGREIFYGTKEITQQLMGRYFYKIPLIQIIPETTEFRFLGENIVGNKIITVRKKIKQKALSQDQREKLIEIFDSKDLKFQLLDKLDIALTLLQDTGGKPHKLLLDFFQVLKVNGLNQKLKQIHCRLQNIIQIYEIIEEQLFEELEKEVHSGLKVDLNLHQKQGVQLFFKKEKEYIADFSKALSRLIIRKLKIEPKIDKRVSLYSALFQCNQSFEELWGVDGTRTYLRMKKIEWNQKYPIFSQQSNIKIEVRQAYSLNRELQNCIEQQKEEEKEIKRKQEERQKQIKKKDQHQGGFQQSMLNNFKAKKRPHVKERGML